MAANVKMLAPAADAFAIGQMVRNGSADDLRRWMGESVETMARVERDLGRMVWRPQRESRLRDRAEAQAIWDACRAELAARDHTPLRVEG